MASRVPAGESDRWGQGSEAVWLCWWGLEKGARRQRCGAGTLAGAEDTSVPDTPRPPASFVTKLLRPGSIQPLQEGLDSRQEGRSLYTCTAGKMFSSITIYTQLSCRLWASRTGNEIPLFLSLGRIRWLVFLVHSSCSYFHVFLITF